MKKGILIASLICAALMGAYLYMSPYLTVRSMRDAAKDRDGEKLSEHIDFPTVRQNLKGQLKTHVLKSAADEDNPYSALGTALGLDLVDGLIDAFVTPSGIIALMNGNQVFEEVSESDLRGEVSDPFSGVDIRYISFSEFQVEVPTREDSSDTRFIFKRKGLGWKLSEIRVPLDEES